MPLLLGWGLAAGAEEPQRAKRGVELAKEGRCASALPELDAARLAAPDDAELALLAGQCRVRLRRYAEAARYHADDFAGARTALDRARPGLPDDARLWLYDGMLLLERGETQAAVRSLGRARQLDPEEVEPVASYYLGVAHAQALDLSSAGTALQRVSDAWRGTDWSTRAEQHLRRLRSGSARHAWLAVGAGFEHDTNVVLRGRGVSLPENISDDDDQRGVWTANAGLELWKSADASLGAMASYRGTTHTDLDDFDAHFPSVTAWLDLALAESTRATARYDFGYAWLDGDPFVATHGWQLSLRRAWSGRGASELFGRAILDDYFFDSEDVPSPADCSVQVGAICGPLGLDEGAERRRSGFGFATGLGHSLPLPNAGLPLRELAVRGGYEFSVFDAHGREYSHEAHEAELGVAAELPLEIDLDASGSFTYRPYRHPTTFPDQPVPTDGTRYTLSGKDRVDEVYRVETSLTRSLGERLSVSGYWRFTDNRSNAEVFDYEQHVLGIHFTVGFGREL